MIKIVKDTAETQYELTYLLPPSYTDAQLKEIQEKVKKLVQKNDGKIVAEDDWGKKALAYEIKHNGERYQTAHYVHWTVEFEPEKAAEFKPGLNLVDEVMRYLLVVKE